MNFIMRFLDWLDDKLASMYVKITRQNIFTEALEYGYMQSKQSGSVLQGMKNVIKMKELKQ